MQDLNDFAKGNEQIKEFEILEQSPEKSVIYEVISMGMFMSERELYVQVTKHPQPDGKILYLT